MAKRRPRFQVRASSSVEIEITEGAYAGLWMQCASVTSMGGYFTFARRAVEGASQEEIWEGNDAKLARFGDEVLIDWNLDDSAGRPLPATADGMRSIPLDLAFDLLNRWLEALTEVPAPLGAESNSGNTSEEGSIPMEPLSASQPR